MTILYRQVPITSPEQAEALPDGTIATTQHVGGGVWRKRNRESWDKLRAHENPGLWTNHGIANPDAALVALIPVEVSEEDEYDVFDIPHGGKIPGVARYHRHVYTTPWEIG